MVSCSELSPTHCAQFAILFQFMGKTLSILLIIIVLNTFSIRLLFQSKLTQDKDIAVVVP